MLNRIILMGRLTRDPELRHTQSGTPVASLTLAVERDFKDQSTGEKPTDFIDVVAWRSTAEFASRYFSKGRMAVVEGRLQIRNWTDKDGNRRKSAEVNADNIYFGDSKKPEDGGYNQRQNDDYAPPPGGYGAQSGGYGGGYNDGYRNNQFTELEDDDGELPF
jgi:single-strand DNA-binding protein